MNIHFKNYLLALSLLIYGFGICSVCSCRRGYIEDGTKCYKYYANHVPWDQANTTCKADNSSLIKMEELTMFRLVQSKLLDTGRGIWVGARRRPGSKIIQWLDGDNVSRFWSTGHPKKDEYECVAATYSRYNPSLNDRKCEQKLPFVCEGKCKSDYILYRNICYKYFADAASWEEAATQCKRENSTLIKIDTSDSLLLLESIVNNNAVSSIWVGARRKSNSREFQWINGANVSKFWNTGEPNNHGGIEDCVDFVMGFPGFLVEVQCTYGFPFVCEVTQEASEQLTTQGVTSQGTPRDKSNLFTETSAQLTTQGAISKGAPEDKSDTTLQAVKIAVPSVVIGLLSGALTAVVCIYLKRRKHQRSAYGGTATAANPSASVGNYSYQSHIDNELHDYDTVK